MKKGVGYAVLVILIIAAALFVYKKFIPSGTEKISLYFTRGDAVIPVARQVPRTRALDEKVRTAINLLLEGPNESEKAAGYGSELPEGTQFLGIFLEGEVAFLNFSRQVEEGGGTQEMQARLRQIVYTATQFSGVEKVRFLIENKPIKYFSSEGLTEVEGPIGRSDLEMEEK